MLRQCVCVHCGESCFNMFIYQCVLRIIILSVRCCKWGIMRFDDPEPTQLLNGYTPHLDRKCCLNCQMRQFLSVFPPALHWPPSSRPSSPHARRKSPSRWYHRKIFQFYARHFFCLSDIFPLIFSPFWLKRKCYIFKNDNLFLVHFFVFPLPSSFDHIELCLPRQQTSSVRFWKLP